MFFKVHLLIVKLVKFGDTTIILIVNNVLLSVAIRLSVWCL